MRQAEQEQIGQPVETEVSPVCSIVATINDISVRIHRDGSYHCFRCTQHGSWFDLKQKVLGSGLPPRDPSRVPEVLPGRFFLEEDGERGSSSGTKTEAIVLPDQRVAFSYHLNLFPLDEHASGSGNVLIKRARDDASAFIEKRGLSLEVCRKFGVGMTVQEFPADVDTREANGVPVKVPWTKELCLSFPWMCALTDLTPTERDAYDKLDAAAKPSSVGDSCNVILRTKVRALSTKGKQRLLPKGGGYGLFGWHLVSADHSSIIITEG